MIRFFSAAFGENYVRSARALIKSFENYSPLADFRLFTDCPKKFDKCQIFSSDIKDLLNDLDCFHQNPDGQLQNAFKFSLFSQMRKKFPHDDLCWIDADMLVLDELTNHLKPGYINVMTHGRRNGQIISCGAGLYVSGERYAIGGLYSLPPGGAEDFLLKISRERYTWSDVAPLVAKSGDQITLNHLVARSGIPIHWITDDKRYIYNLEIADGIHPTVGDPGLKSLELKNNCLIRSGRQVAVFCWIKNKLDAHLKEDFYTFQPTVANFLRKFYRDS